jgi:hypothetical protein
MLRREDHRDAVALGAARTRVATARDGPGQLGKYGPAEIEALVDYVQASSAAGCSRD